MKVEQRENPELETSELAAMIAESTWDLKALNTVVIDLRNHVTYTDFVVVCTGSSDRHVQAIAKHVEAAVREWCARKPYGREGLDSAKWALIDFGDVILHVFNGPVRDDYDLERMWPDAPRMELEDKPKDLYGHFELDEFPREPID
jgi:ribosome-associated protein